MADKPATPSDSPSPVGQPVPPGAFPFPPRAVAVVAVLLAVSCLGTLVIVATQKNVDALSTIALALAILAFVAQLIIYIVQAATSNQQLFLAQQVQRETATILSGIQASAEAIQTALAQQYERVIDRLIDTTAEAEVAPGEDDEGEEEESREALLNRLRGIVREEIARSQPTLTSPSSLYKIDPTAGLYWRSPSRIVLTDPIPGARGEPSPFQFAEDPSTLREDPSKLREGAE